MISLNSLKKSCGVSNPEGMLALFMCSLFGILLVALVPEKRQQKLKVENITDHLVLDGSEALDAVNEIGEVDLKGIVEFCVAHTTASRGFVIFRNGSCVLIPEPCEDPVAVARGTMEKIFDTEEKFLTERTAEGDLMITFKESVFHRIPGSHVNQLERWTLRNLSDLLSQKERVAAPMGWIPPVDARLGLVARKRLLMDAEGGDIVRILRPNTSVAKADGEMPPQIQ